MPFSYPKSVLVTGGAGFIGSNFLRYFVPRYTHCQIVNIDALTYAANSEYIQDLERYPHYHFIQCDICDKSTVGRLFSEYRFDGVINFAAESHVDNSITGPRHFLETNVCGTFTLLEAARSLWMSAPHQTREEFKYARFYQISTDEVYGSLGSDGYFSEESPFLPNSPYSASKAAGDLFVRAYGKTYGLPTLRSHCSNNYGPNQHQEKFIPTIIRKALIHKKIPIYGQGNNIRDWLYVDDHVTAIELIFTQSDIGSVYTIGGKEESTNLELARKICHILDQIKPRKEGSYCELLAFVDDRPGHDLRYAIDYSKFSHDFGWHPRENLSNGLLKTIQWYLTVS